MLQISGISKILALPVNLVPRVKNNSAYFTYSLTDAITFKDYLENKGKQLYVRVIFIYNTLLFRSKGFYQYQYPAAKSYFQFN